MVSPRGIDAHVRDAADRHAPVPDRARDVQAADVFGGVGDHRDHVAAPQPLNEEQRRREDDDQGHHQEQAKPRVAFLDGHRSHSLSRGHAGRRPREEAVHERDLRLVAQRARVAARHDPLRRLVQDDAVLATRKMLGSSWVTITIVMPRSRLSVTMS